MNTKDDLAIDALIAASLRMNSFKNAISDTEAIQSMQSAPDLTSDEINAIDSIDILNCATEDVSVRSDSLQVQEKQGEYEKSVLALNRKNTEDQHDAEQLKEMKEKRQEIRNKLKKKDDGKSNDSKTN